MTIREEPFRDRKAEDFDFPCSQIWRSYYDETWGYPYQRTPEVCNRTQDELPPAQVTVIRPTPDMKRTLEQLGGMFQHLHNHYHVTHFDKRKDVV